MLMGVGSDNHFRVIHKNRVPHSLGHLYAAFTDYLGFMPFFDEWKVMGMSAYGQERYRMLFDDILRLTPDGFRLNLEYFSFHTHGQRQWTSKKVLKVLGPKRAVKAEYDQRCFDIACSLQKAVERAGVHLANVLYARTKNKALCVTGGVALNCLMNKAIVEQTPFEEFFFQPVASDAGTSLGSALYYYHQVLKKPRRFVFEHPYWGPEFSNEKIEEVLRAENLVYHRETNIARATAEKIAQGKIVGWFQGRMEAGPRALGCRSIVVDPRDPGMKDRLNARVKKREHFRPFAPSVIEEKASEYFILPKGQPSPYMILIADVVEGKKKVIPAVTHNDGTARFHTVRRATNPRYWDLINEFGKITGVPVLLNTSFNENEPIVCTPLDAVRCFLRTEFDVLSIGDFLVLKEENRGKAASL